METLATLRSRRFVSTSGHPFESEGFSDTGATLPIHHSQQCPDSTGDPGTPSYSPGTIESVRDLDGDGHPEAVITEGGSYCFGMAGTGYSIVSKKASGAWKLITSNEGVPNILATKGMGGWPDIEIGGPGFCFPVERWNGSSYVINRHQYEGKACHPPRQFGMRSSKACCR